MSCTEHLDILRTWDPDAGDLPDDSALHLDECVACRAAFDARFAPVELPVEAAPEGLAERVVPERPRRRYGLLFAGVGLAAVSLLAIGGVASVGLVTMRGGAVQDPSVSQLAWEGGEPTEVEQEQLLQQIGYLKGGQHTRYSEDPPEEADAMAMAMPESPPGPHASPPDKNELLIYDGSSGARPHGVKGGVEGGVEGGRVDGVMGGVTADQGGTPAEQSTGETYVDHGTNAFTRTSVDPLSTFAVDVDTASYTLSRRKLRAGWLPPAEAVRVEEFVNYLPYEYAPPTTDAPFAVDLEAVPSPFHPGYHLVRVGVQGEKVSSFDRKPVHLTFLVDTSGSMGASDKLPLARYALEQLVGELEDGDTVAIVAYAGSAGQVLAPTPMSRRVEVLSALRRLSSGGSTAMGDGIQLAYDLADQAYAEGAVNRVVILSDGDANVGPSSRGALTELVKDHAGRGITLTTLGFGQGNYKDATMERLADEGDGNYYYIDSQQEARRVFVDRLTGTMQVIARDVKLQIEFDEDAVRSWRQVGYENRQVADRDFRNDAVDAGEIGAGHQVTALYEVQLTGPPRGELAVVRVRAKPPGPDAPAREWRTRLSAEDVRSTFDESSDDTRMAVAMASFAELLRASPWMIDATYGEVLDIAVGARRAEYPEDLELIELIRAAQRLDGGSSEELR